MTLPGLVVARSRAESLMTSTCTIRERDGEWTTGEDGEASQAPGATVYSGKCRVRPAGTQAQPGSSGGDETFDFDYLVSVPFSVTAVAEGQVLTVDSAPDPALVGATVEIRRVDRGDQITARRLACTEVV